MAFKLKSGNTIQFKQMGSSPAKHSGKEMWSQENNPSVDRGHTKEGVPEYKNTIKNRLKMETRHDAFHTKHGPDHDLPRVADRTKTKDKGAEKAKSPAKDMKTGSYEHSFESPAKQYEAGGTKSGKGNIFTKRGRKQRKLNKHAAELAFENYAFNQAKIKREAEKEKSPAKQKTEAASEAVTQAQINKLKKTKKPKALKMYKDAMVTGATEAVSEAISQAQINKLKEVKGKKVDPDAPGTPGTPGYEPPVKYEDLDEKGKKLWHKVRSKKKRRTMTDETKMKPPYKEPVGPRAS